MFTIYIFDPAHGLFSQTFTTQDEADDAADRWEDLGCTIFINRDWALAQAA